MIILTGTQFGKYDWEVTTPITASMAWHVHAGHNGANLTFMLPIMSHI
jgi:hypothetical protein